MTATKLRDTGASRWMTAIVSALLLWSGFCMQACAQSVASGSALSRSQFSNPPRDFGPLIRWWWPGGDVSDAELDRELGIISQAGFKGVEIQSFAVGVPGTSPNVYNYGTPAWFEKVAAALRSARNYGLTVDMTLGSAWPAAGPYIDDSKSLRQLTLSQLLLKGGTAFSGKVPAVSQPLYYDLAKSLLALPNTFDAGKMRRLNVTAIRLDPDQNSGATPGRSTYPGLPDLPPTRFLDGRAIVDLTGLVDGSGNLVWNVPAGDWILFSVYEGPTGSQPFYSAAPGKSLVLDHLDSTAIQLHLGAVAQPLRDALGPYIGTTLRSLFVDSLELRTELYWTTDFAAQFAFRRGYRIEPFLPILFKPFAYDTYMKGVYPDAPPSFDMRNLGPKIRKDYERTVSELMVERFLVPVRQWANEHGMTARVQAHGGPADDEVAYASADIAETEGLYAGGAPAFLKRAASAAHVAGQPVVSSEVLSIRLPARIGVDTIQREANKQFASGVNQLVLHGYPYIYDTGFPYPGWMPFQSPYLPAIQNLGSFGTRLNERNPLWPYMSTINTYLARAQLMMRTVDPVADVAVLSARTRYPDGSPPPALNVALERGGYLYDYVDAAPLLASTTLVDGNGLRVGAMRYKALIISNADTIAPQVLARIGELAAMGLPVVFVGALPAGSDSLRNYPADDAAVVAGVKQIFSGASRENVTQGASYRFGSVAYLGDANSIADFLAGDFSIAPDVELGNARGSVLYAHRRGDGADYFFLNNTTSDAVDAVLTFRGTAGRPPEVWNLWNGAVSVAETYVEYGANTAVVVHIEPGAALALGFDSPRSVYHVEATSSPITLQRNSDNAIDGTVDAPGRYTLTLGGGETRVIDVSGPAPARLNVPVWDLSVSYRDQTGAERIVSYSRIPAGDLVSGGVLPDGVSGTAVYTGYFSLDSTHLQSGVRLMLDLGKVADAARLQVNDRRVDLAPAGPYLAYLTGTVGPGLNKIEVAVPFVGGSPSGLIGPVNIVPRYTFTVALPLPFSVVVTPPNFPNNSPEDMIAAINTAATLTRHVNFQWYWRTPPSSAAPNGGNTVGCDTIVPWIVESRRLGLAVTLQFQTFFVQLGSDGQAPTVQVATPVMPFQTATFANADLSNQYLEQIACLAALQPEYLVLGPEMNFAVTYNYREFQHFLPVYAQAYDLVKKISPKTQVGMSWQYDGLRMSLPLDDWGYVKNAGPQDFYGLTSYYGYSDQRFVEYPTAASIPADYYYPVRAVLGNDKPILFSEIGWSSFYPQGLSNQVAFLRRASELFSQINPVGAVWALLHDVNYFEGPGQSLNNSGLRDSDGSPKPVWNEANRLMGQGALVQRPDSPAARVGLPFSITIGPTRFPQQYSQQAVFDAIGNAKAASNHVSIQVAWKDEASGQVWDCAALAPIVQEVRRQGLALTLQWNTYATRPVPGAQAGTLPEILLFNPINPPVQGAANQPSISDPAIQAAWLREIQCIGGLRPDYLVLGPEINFVHALRPAEYAAFLPIYREGYARVKAASPGTRVGLSFQYFVMRDDYLRNRDLRWIGEIGSQDFIGLTMYFAESDSSLQLFPSPLSIPTDLFAPIRQIFAPEVPIVFTEIAWSSHYPQGLTNQVTFLSRLPALLESTRPVNVIWAMQHDLYDYFKSDIAALNDNGLSLNDGTPKPGWSQAIRLRSTKIFHNP